MKSTCLAQIATYEYNLANTEYPTPVFNGTSWTTTFIVAVANNVPAGVVVTGTGADCGLPV